MLVVARAPVPEPKVLLVDELSLGLAPIVAEQLASAIRTIADSAGSGVLLVDQHVEQALRYVDRACAG